jgi:hypothetical protein
MREPFRITFHNMASPFGADDLARDSVIDLERMLGRAIMCKMTIEKRHPRRSHGNLFTVDIELTVSGWRFAVRRDPPDGHAHENLDIAIADAFRLTRHQLQKRGLGPITGGRGDPPVFQPQPRGPGLEAAASE